MGGILNLFQIYTPSEFEDINLRRVWRWLQIKSRDGKNTIWDYNAQDPTAPKFSLIAESITDTLDFQLKEYLLYEND